MEVVGLWQGRAVLSPRAWASLAAAAVPRAWVRARWVAVRQYGTAVAPRRLVAPVEAVGQAARPQWSPVSELRMGMGKKCKNIPLAMVACK